MRDTNLAGIDLNLLPPLEALLRLRNVTYAAAEVGLSQPAMSRTLARLRHLLGDPLLVRTGAGYVLTPRSRDLLPALGAALEDLRGLLHPPAFDPAGARSTVRIACSDTQAILLMPAVMARLAREAPGLDLHLVPYSADMIPRMAAGRLDLAFALATTPLPPGARSEAIAQDRLVMVMRRGHPLADMPLSIADYAVVDHAGIAILGDGLSDLDAALAASGISRRIAVVTPHFTAALAAVAATDLVSTLSHAFASRFAAPFGLVLREPPLPETAMTITLVWSHLRAGDRLLVWLRGLIRDVAATLHHEAAATA
ncbi:LysR family transcriptional regulator [Phreatobacter sp.]|uniref:LysR family transcriptional regulator n=1 Tax=Phreatobacter sp. TaxID=1966341 RepID=UPI0022C8AD14|nr:LysR family transcriptional regulator [Phreatobacter sp.]MCZ8315255.1 LysR family transcriptional regulator [Phreatobacter sp.]